MRKGLTYKDIVARTIPSRWKTVSVHLKKVTLKKQRINNAPEQLFNMRTLTSSFAKLFSPKPQVPPAKALGHSSPGPGEMGQTLSPSARTRAPLKSINVFSGLKNKIKLF